MPKLQKCTPITFVYKEKKYKVAHNHTAFKLTLYSNCYKHLPRGFAPFKLFVFLSFTNTPFKNNYY